VPTLNWIGKNKVINHHQDVPFRVLDRKYICGSDDDSIIIHGDNLDALKALLPRYEGRVKCVYIDPSFAHWDLCSYDDGVIINGQTERKRLGRSSTLRRIA